MSSTQMVTETEVRLSYENLLVPRVANEGEDPTFSTMIVIPKSDTATLAAVNAAINAALQKGITEKWKGNKPGNLKHPLRDGDVEKSDDPNMVGMMFFNAKGPRAGAEPAFLYAKNGRQVTAHDKDATEVIYSGVHGRVSLNFYAYDTKGNKGVAAGIVAFMSHEHGERLDNKPTATSALAAFGIDPLAVHSDAAEESSAPSAAAPQASEPVSAESDPWGN